MNAKRIKEIIQDCIDTITFIHKGKSCGIESEVHDYIPTFDMWYGNEVKEYSNVDDLMQDKFFDGEALEDIADQIDIQLS